MMLHRKVGRSGPSGHFNLVVDALKMTADRFTGNDKLRRDFRVGETVGHKTKYVKFALCKVRYMLTSNFGRRLTGCRQHRVDHISVESTRAYVTFHLLCCLFG